LDRENLLLKTGFLIDMNNSVPAKGLWNWSVPVCGSSVKGTWREESLAANPAGYVEKALETGISFHGGPVWGTWRTHLPATLRDGWKGLWRWASLFMGVPFGEPGGGLIYQRL
jgi:hypothetical protein